MAGTFGEQDQKKTRNTPNSTKVTFSTTYTPSGQKERKTELVSEFSDDMFRATWWHDLI